MILPIATAMAALPAAAMPPPLSPVYCRDSTGTDQPIRQTNYARLVAAHRDLFGFKASFIRSSNGDRLVFRGGVRNAETISYAARLRQDRSGRTELVLLSSQAQFADGASDKTSGTEFCSTLFGVIYGDRGADELAAHESEGESPFADDVPDMVAREVNEPAIDFADMVLFEKPTVRPSYDAWRACVRRWAEHSPGEVSRNAIARACPDERASLHGRLRTFVDGQRADAALAFYVSMAANDAAQRQQQGAQPQTMSVGTWTFGRTKTGSCKAIKAGSDGLPSALLAANDEGTLLAFPARIVEANLSPHDVRTSVTIEAGGRQTEKVVSFQAIDPLGDGV